MTTTTAIYAMSKPCPRCGGGRGSPVPIESRYKIHCATCGQFVYVASRSEIIDRFRTSRPSLAGLEWRGHD